MHMYVARGFLSTSNFGDVRMQILPPHPSLELTKKYTFQYCTGVNQKKVSSCYSSKPYNAFVVHLYRPYRKPKTRLPKEILLPKATFVELSHYPRQ